MPAAAVKSAEKRHSQLFLFFNNRRRIGPHQAGVMPVTHPVQMTFFKA